MDPEARAEDEHEEAHGIRELVEKLHDADFASAYGHPFGRDAVEKGLIGAALGEDRFLAWFHWPRYDGAA